MSESRSEIDPVELLAESFLERYRRGERPALSEYTERHPELAEQIRELFPALMVVEELGSVGEKGSGGLGDLRSSTQIPEQLGEYRILRLVGRGGMGIVFEAVQESLGRHVALKVLPLHGLLSPTHMERFRREARAAARLHHTNIVPVFGIGESDGINYYAMQFIHGQGLNEVLREVRRLREERDRLDAPESTLASGVAQGLVSGQFAGGPGEGQGIRDEGPGERSFDLRPSTFGPKIEDRKSNIEVQRSSSLSTLPEPKYFRSVAQVGIQVAEALEYAHAEGILHRDVKPSNLLLDTSGRVWITDFGLAKAQDWDELTSPGDIVGTVPYMAPERFQGQADAQSDVYGLGVTLYEMLTLKAPFEDSNRARLIERVAREEPVPPRKIDHAIPRDLETVVLKAAAKEPARRYPTAAALAEDLRRFLADRPVRARRATLRERGWRWCRRNPVLALTATLALAALGAVAGLAIALAIHQHHAAVQAQAQRDEADEAASQLRAEQEQTKAALLEAQAQRRLAEQSAANLALDQALNLCEQGDVALGMLWLTRSLQITPDHAPELKRVIRANLAAWRNELTPLRALLPHDESVSAVAFSPDGKMIATGCGDGWVRIWDEQTGNLLVPPLWFESGILFTVFSPDGRALLAGGGGPQAQLWEVATGKPLGRLVAKSNIAAAAFSPDARTIVTAGWRGKVQRWSAATGAFLGDLTEHSLWFLSLAISSDGRTVLTGSEDKTARLWDAATGQPKGEPLRHHQEGVRAVAISHDGARLLTGSLDRTAQLWDAATLKPVGLPLQHRRPVYAVDFSSDGRMILTGSLDGTAQVWDASTLKPLGLPLQHRGPVLAATFSPDGKAVITGGTDNAARLWDVTALRRSGITLAKHPSWIRGLAFSPSGGHLLTGGDHAPAQVWNLNIQQPVAAPLHNTDRVRALAFHPDGTMCLTVGLEDGIAQLWDLQSGKPIGPALRTRPPVFAAAFSPDGRTFLTGTDDGTVQPWDTAAVCLGRHAPASSPLRHPGDVKAVAWSPDGKTIATAGMDGTARLWDAATGQANGSPLGHAGPVWAVAFCPDSRTIGTGSWDGTVRLWDVATARPVGRPLQHQGKVEAVAFSPDGKTLATGCFDNKGRLWDVASGKPIGPPLVHDDLVLAVAFHPSGETVATTGADGMVRLWPVPTPINDPVQELILQTELLTGMRLEPGGAATPLDVKSWADRCWRRELPLYSFAIALCPFHPEFYYRRGLVYERLGQLEKAATDWTQALTWWQSGDSRRLADLHVRRGHVYLAINHYRLAASHFRRALELQPDQPAVCNELAWLDLTCPQKLRDPYEALRLARKALTLEPGNWNYTNTLGVAQYRLGQYQEAIPTLQRSLKEGHAPAFDLFFLAMCHARLGNAQSARDCFDRAVGWVQENEGKLNSRWKEELTAFRAEAEAALASPESR